MDTISLNDQIHLTEAYEPDCSGYISKKLIFSFLDYKVAHYL